MIMKQGDTAPDFVFDTNANLTGATVTASMNHLDGTQVFSGRSCTITDAPNGIGSFAWIAGDTDAVGAYRVDIRVVFAGGKIERFPQASYLEVLIRPKVGA